MNDWIKYVKEYASKKGMKYSEALKDPACKEGYKKKGKGIGASRAVAPEGQNPRIAPEPTLPTATPITPIPVGVRVPDVGIYPVREEDLYDVEAETPSEAYENAYKTSIAKLLRVVNSRREGRSREERQYNYMLIRQAEQDMLNIWRTMGGAPRERDTTIFMNLLERARRHNM